MTFMRAVQQYDKNSQISIASVTYFTFGRQYSFQIKPTPCKPERDLQNVELVLICQRNTGN